MLSNHNDSITHTERLSVSILFDKLLYCGYICLIEKIRVLISDGHPAFGEGLCQLLEHEEDLECIAKLADGEEAVRLAIKLLPDVTIIDIAMPKLNGIEATE